MGLSVEVLETGELGDRSYIAHDGELALVVDPQRDLDRVEHRLDGLGVRIALVAETHVHNDYVTGGFALARRAGVPYLVSAGDAVAFARDPIADGGERCAGALHLRAVASPGHTDAHLAYVVDAGGPPVAFTGGSLLYGSVGRTDLVDAARTEELSRAQYRSAHHLADLLADDTPVHPTHGFGSFCSAGPATGGATSTVGAQRRCNDALLEPDEDAFVARLRAGLTPYPRYYAHMGPRNRGGPPAADLTPPEPVDAAELHRRIAAGEWVVDVRDRGAYAAEHVAGTIGIALDGAFSPYLGWLVPWGTPVTLVGATAGHVREAQRRLVRIGIDRPAGVAVGPPPDLAGPAELRTYPVVGFAELAAALDRGDGAVVLDVRRDDERAQGAIPGSAHLPLHDLLDRLSAVPDGELWVHCASGYRAGIAASLLARAGHHVVLVDDDYSVAVASGLATG